MPTSKSFLTHSSFLQRLNAQNLSTDSVIAAKIGEKIYGLYETIPDTLEAEIVWIDKSDPQARHIIQTSCQTILAASLRLLFPQVQLAQKGIDDNGFFYDFDTTVRLKESDLERVEHAMHSLIQQMGSDLQIEILNRSDIVKGLQGNPRECYRQALLESTALNADKMWQIKIAGHEEFLSSVHVLNASFCQNFSLLSISGAYWQGESSEKMLQRIYGIAYCSQEELEQWKKWREEMKERDHRHLGKVLDLFHFQEESPGAAFWHPKGLRCILAMQELLRKALRAYDYQEVLTPQILNRQLWERSGHWEQFSENMFVTQAEHHALAIKPMSCPGHIQIFNYKRRSHRDLPFRMTEFGICHRKEPSGSLHGLMRTRVFTQDDVHILCTPDQLYEEIISSIQIIAEIYKKFGFTSFEIKCSTRPKNRLGNEKTWDLAESTLIQLMQQSGFPNAIQEGEGAFYGPKLEFTLKDALGRSWQCGTVQLDFVLPQRLEVHYVNSDGESTHPIMIHRAQLGSLERFFAMVLESCAGVLPFWLSPVHCAVMNISEKQTTYAKEISELLKSHGLYVETDLSNEKLGFKIRQHILQKIPFLIICGDKEVETQTISVRCRGSNEVFSALPDHFAKTLAQALHNYSISLPGGCFIEH